MSTPDPVPSRSGWVPTTSTLAGAGMGAYVANLIIAGIEYYGHLTLSSMVVTSIAGLCVGLAGYLFPDGGRR